MANAAGTTKAFGDQNVLVGNYAVPATTGDANTIAIGYDCTGNGANTATIGNTSVISLHTPTIIAKGNLTTNLSDSSNTCSGTGNRDVESTAHGLVAGAAVKDAESPANVYTVASVTDANNFVIDSNGPGAGDEGQWTTDPSFLKILTGDGATALEFTNRRQLDIVDPLDNIVITDTVGGDAFTTANKNVLIGPSVGTDITTGGSNVMIGYQTGMAVTTGAHNIMMGYQAGGGDAASNNVCIGYNTLSDSHNGQLQNVAVGIESLQANQTAHNNTAVGFRSGQSLTTGQQCVFVGGEANTSSVTSNNQIVIGQGSSCDAANTAVIGNASLVLIRPGSNGNVELGNASYEWDDIFTENVTDSSDGRGKEQI